MTERTIPRTDWEFTRHGGWKQIPSPLDDGDGTGSFKDWMRLNGYTGEDTIGGEDDSSAMEVYYTEGFTGAYPYVAIVNQVYGSYLIVLVPSAPDLFALAEAIYPFWEMRHAAFRDESMEELLKKWFRADHGHDYIYACPNCDPDTYERARQASAARRAK